jgi:hypothetical protein
LEHLVAAVLGSKYNFELEPDGEEHFSITMKLANYDVAPGTEISEGTISLAEGVPDKTCEISLRIWRRRLIRPQP